MNWTRWNKWRYTFYAPVYDGVARIFDQARAKSIRNLNIDAHEHVLIVGGGTGLDLPHFPDHARITFTDLTPEMVRRARSAYSKLNVDICFEVADGSNLPYEDQTFDAIVLHLIVAVIPDPEKLIREVDRVLKPGGRIAVMDKFRESAKPSVLRRILNPVTRLLFSDINRRIEDLVPEKWHIKSDEGVLLGRTFRSIIYMK